MKKFKKVMALGLALALIFSSMGNVFAYTLDGKNYDGFQVGDTFYSLQYINSHVDSFRGVFSDEDPENVIIDFNKKPVEYQTLIDAVTDGAVINDFDAWAATAARPNPPQSPNKLYKPDGTLVTIGEQELEVVSFSVVNSTTIRVGFSDGITEDITVAELQAGSNTRTFSHDGVSFTRTFNYNPPAQVAAVQRVDFEDYRHFTVTFNTEVDPVTAADPANYYLELVEGNAEYSAAVIGISNQLEDLDTNYLTGVDAWWATDVNDDDVKDHISASVVNGKTVVDIYLPEDSRFTNELDLTSHNDDDERTIIANMANLVDEPQSNTKAMIKDTTVYVGVRNVRDEDGDRTINTRVLPMFIQDTTAPQFEGFEVVTDTGCEKLGADRPVVVLHADGSDTAALEFNEPVFDAHGLGVDDINNSHKYNVAVYVDNILVGSRDTHDLDHVLKFAMSEDNTYDDSRFATLDVERAVNKAYRREDKYRGCGEFRISIVGIPDLAGNTQVPNPVEFTAKIVEPEPVNPDDPVIPDVLGVAQIHDNVFRVMFNRDNVYAKFEIDNADGETGRIDANIEGNQTYEKPYYYTDIFVPAVDIETTVDNEINGKDDNMLAYDDANTLVRKVRVYEVKVPSQSLEGEAWCEPSFIITKDIYKPDFIQPDTIDFDLRNSGTITIGLEDVVPDSWMEVGQPVYAMLYDYRYNHNNVFEPTIDVEETENYAANGPIDYSVNEDPDLLPIKVSFVDKNGATHAALVSNKWLSEDFSWPWLSGVFKAGWNDGHTGSIKYYTAEKELVLDLSEYPQLTDEQGYLFPGVTYKVELPDGYFADPAKFNAYDLQQANVETSQQPPVFSDILYVSDGRQNNGDHSFIVRGYTTNETEILVDVDGPADPLPADDAVPQTSKHLINYMQDANEIWVEFTGQIKESTLEEADNFMVNGLTLAQLGLPDTAVTYVKQLTDIPESWDPSIECDLDELTERQFAQIKLGYDTIAISGDYTFDVFGVTNLVGGMMTPVSTRIDLAENTRPIVEKSKVASETQIMLTFDEALMYGDDVDDDEINAGLATAANFEIILNGGAALNPATAVLSEEDHKTVTLTLPGANFITCNSIIVTIVVDQNENLCLEDISDNHNPIALDTIIVK